MTELKSRQGIFLTKLKEILVIKGSSPSSYQRQVQTEGKVSQMKEGANEELVLPK